MSKVLILGAGPAGLSAGYVLAKQGYEVAIIEMDKQVGGISKTIEEKGYRFDLGGHRFFTKIEEVNKLWNEVLKDDFMLRPRLSRIYYRGKFFDYPIKPFNALSGLGIYEALLIIGSYIKVKIKPVKPEESFEDWVSNRFGRRLYQHFFKTYTEKVWGIPGTELKAEWAAQRIQGLSLVSAVVNALLKQFQKNTIKTLIEEFNYPRFGPGQMYETMAADIISFGGEVQLNTRVIGLNRNGNRIESVITSDADGQERELKADYIISSLPLRQTIAMMNPSPDDKVLKAGNSLKYRDFLTVDLALNKEFLFPDNWIYVHSPEVKLGRIQNFKQWSPAMVPEDGCSSLGLEYFCNEGDELWRSADEDLVKMAVDEICHLGLIKREWVKWGLVVRVPKAYPVYDDDYQAAMPILINYMNSLDNFQTIGRNGLHRYNNMDHSILTGLLAAENIRGQFHDLWQVNTEEEYHEEIR